MLFIGEPGGFQVEAALQSLPGCRADGAVFVEAGKFVVLGADQVAAQFPPGQAVRFCPWLPSIRARVRPMRACRLARTRPIVASRGCVFSSEFVEPGQGGFREP